MYAKASYYNGSFTEGSVSYTHVYTKDLTPYQSIVKYDKNDSKICLFTVSLMVITMTFSYYSIL